MPEAYRRVDRIELLSDDREPATEKAVVEKADGLTYIVAHCVFTNTQFRDEKRTRRTFAFIVTTMMDGMIAVMGSIAFVIAQRWFGAAFDRWLQNRLTTSTGELIVTHKWTFTARVLVA